MSSKIEISVVIPFGNQLRFLKDALQSVYKQTLLPSEIIIVDDFSNENPADLIKSLENKSIPVKHIRFNEHRGPSVARNEGIKQAVFPYIAFLDADDCWSATHLFDFRQALKQFGTIGFYATASGIFYKSCPKKKNYDSPVFTKDTYVNLALENAMNINSSSVIFSKALLKRTGFFNEQIHVFEDIDYWLRAGQNAETVWNRKKNVFIRRSGSGSLSNRLEYYTGKEIETMFHNLLEKDGNEPYKKFIHLNLYGTIMRFKKQGKTPPDFYFQLLNTKYLSPKRKLLLKIPAFLIKRLAK
jgi:glycosyltransferase involved in cell wall biosynthesis